MLSRVMFSWRFKPALPAAAIARQITPRWLRDEGLPADRYAPGDALILEPRRPPRDGELVVAEVRRKPAPAGREALYRFAAGAAVIRFAPARPGAASIQVPASDLVLVGVVIGLRRAL